MTGSGCRLGNTAPYKAVEDCCPPPTPRSLALLDQEWEQLRNLHLNFILLEITTTHRSDHDIAFLVATTLKLSQVRFYMMGGLLFLLNL